MWKLQASMQVSSSSVARPWELEQNTSGQASRQASGRPRGPQGWKEGPCFGPPNVKKRARKNGPPHYEKGCGRNQPQGTSVVALGSLEQMVYGAKGRPYPNPNVDQRRGGHCTKNVTVN